MVSGVVYMVIDSLSTCPFQPKDSQHPDRAANVDILVEKWLSEEEYQAAKERRELAWQEEDVHGDVEVRAAWLSVSAIN